MTFFVALARPALAERQPPTPSNPAVKLAAESVDGGYYQRILHTLAGEHPVPGIPNGHWLKDRNSPGNLAVSRDFLKREIEALGFRPHEIQTQDWNVQQWVQVGYDQENLRPIHRPKTPFKAQNIWFEIPGTSRPDEVVTVGAHYDTIGEGVPGANDNATGVTAVLAIAKVFKEKGIRPKRTIRFVLFDQEEPPKMADGSERFFESRLGKNERNVLFVNIDMIGFSPLGSEHSGYSAADFPKAKKLIRKATNEAELGVKPRPFDEFYSDNLSASERGIPALAFTEDGRDHKGRQVEDPNNHTEEDRASEINVPYAIRMTKWATATALLAADSRAEFSTPESEALHARSRVNVRAGRRFNQDAPKPPPLPFLPPVIVPKPEPVVEHPPVSVPKPDLVVVKPPVIVLKPEPVVVKPPVIVLKPEPVVVKPPVIVPKPEAKPVVEHPLVIVPKPEPKPVVKYPLVILPKPDLVVVKPPVIVLKPEPQPVVEHPPVIVPKPEPKPIVKPPVIVPKPVAVKPPAIVPKPEPVVEIKPEPVASRFPPVEQSHAGRVSGCGSLLGIVGGGLVLGGVGYRIIRWVIEPAPVPVTAPK